MSEHLSRLRALAARPRAALRARTHVFILVLACIVPMLGFSAYAILKYSEAEWEEDQVQSLHIARALSATIDLKLKTGAAALEALATSQALHPDSLQRFYERCLETAAQHHAWITFALPTGEPIFNTRSFLGAPLPRAQTSELVQAAIYTGAVQVSGVYQGRVSNTSQISVVVPLAGRGDIMHALIMSFDLEEIRSILMSQNLPESWRAAVVDKENRIIARNRALDHAPLQTVVPELAERLALTNEASFVGTDQSGTSLLSTFTKSAYSGWAMVVGVPVFELNAPFHRSLLSMAIAAGGMLLFGVATAAFIGSRLNRSMGGLSSVAIALARGGDMPLTPIRTKVAEINDVMSSLARASDQLRDRSRQRDRAEAALRESEQRFRDIAEVSADSIWEMGPDFRFTSFRGSFKGEYLIDPPVVIGKTRWELVDADPEQDEIWSRHKQDLEAHRPFRQFRIVSTAKDRRFFLSISGKPIFDDTGGFLGYRGTSTDETAIVEARERAEQAETLLRDALGSTSDAFAIFDREDRLVLFTEQNRALFGDGLEHVQLGMTYEQIMRAGLTKGLYADAVGREEEWLVGRLELRDRATGSAELKLGSGRWILMTDRRMQNGGIASTRTDITALKAAQAALHESEQRFRDVAEVSADWIWETGADSRFTHFHGHFRGRDRVNPPDFIGKTVPEVLGVDTERDEAWHGYLLDMEARRPFRQLRLVSRTGDRRTFLSISGKPRFDEAGRFLGYRGTATDETAIIEAREQVDRAEALLRDAVESTSEGFAIFDAQDRLVMFNNRNRELYGDSLDHMRPGMTFEEILRAGIAKGFFEKARGREEEWIAERLKQHQAAAGTIEQKLGNGHWLLITERRMASGGIATTRADVTALKAAQTALRESEERLERAQEIAGIGGWELDVATGGYVWSKEMYRIRGLSPDSFDPTMSRLVEYVHKEDWTRVHAWLAELRAGAEQGPLEFRSRRTDGEWRIVLVEGKAILDAGGAVRKISGTMQDITDLRHAEQKRRELEQQLQHSQKLEALGVLAGGIAHDLNNTLVPIFVTAKLGIKHADDGSRLRQSFELIYEAGVRARDLVKRILAFSRKDAIDRRGFRLDQVIADDLAMLRAGIPSTIALETDIQPVPETFGDPDQMHQVVINLVTNGVQAIGNRLGTVTVSLTAVAPGAMNEKPIIRLTVRDTGCGMDEETMRRIFEPFFTTKPVGEGTGLGLSMVHGIVTSHRGTIRVESEPGQGTCFTIELPTLAAPGERAPAREGVAA